MAVIDVTFDTKEKTLVATIDGKKVKNVSEIYFTSYLEGTGGVEVKTMEFEEDESYMKITRLYANEQGEDVVDERREANVDTAKLGELLLKRPITSA
jgi:hypothetical protein